MLKTNNPLKVPIWLGILAGAVLGGIFGVSAKLVLGWSILVGGVLGWVVGGYMQHLKEVFEEGEDLPAKNGVLSEPSGFSTTLKLCEEQLDIIKQQVTTGTVNLRTEVVTEDKNITVPVTREELVIEKTVPDSETCDREEPVTETVRIPLREEQVEINKKMVELEDVNVYRRQFQTTETVNETVKKEQLRVETTGEAIAVSKGKGEAD